MDVTFWRTFPSDRGRVKGTRGHVPPGAHMEGKESSALSRQALHCTACAPGPAGRPPVGPPGPTWHGMRVENGPCMYEQCRRGTLRAAPRPVDRSDACMHAYTWPRWRGQPSYVYGVPYPQRPRLQCRTYVRMYVYTIQEGGEREREELACRFVALRTCSSVPYILHAAAGGTERRWGWRDVSNTRYV